MFEPADLKGNGFLWIASGIALMPDMLLCCLLLYVGYRKLFQRRSLTSVNICSITHMDSGVLYLEFALSNAVTACTHIMRRVAGTLFLN